MKATYHIQLAIEAAKRGTGVTPADIISFI